MTKYYMGKLFYVDSINKENHTLYIADRKVVSSDSHSKKILENTDEKILNELGGLFFYKALDKEKLYSILDKIFTKPELEYQSGSKIIFELIKDENGNLYGKEILSGKYFPIASKIENKYLSTSILDWDMMRESEKRQIYLYRHPTKSEKNIYLDKMGNRIHKTRKTYDGDFSMYDFNDNLFGFYEEIKGYRFDVTFGYNFIHNNLLRGEVFLDNMGYANLSDIEKYKETYRDKKNLFGKVKNYFVDAITNDAKQNVFKDEIIPISKENNEKEREQVDELTKLMEDIELLMLKLKNYNIELYNKYLMEYNKMLDDDNKNLKNITITKGYLEGLKAKILISFNFSYNDGMNIVDYLDNLKKKYLLNILDGEEGKTKITIADLDKINELFLKMKDAYNVSIRRKIIKNISLLYLLELYENKNNLDNLDLENSYLNDNLVSILIHLNTLHDLDLIESDVLINLDSNPKLEDIIYIIKNITFKKISKEKVLTLTF